MYTLAHNFFFVDKLVMLFKHRCLTFKLFESRSRLNLIDSLVVFQILITKYLYSLPSVKGFPTHYPYSHLLERKCISVHLF